MSALTEVKSSREEVLYKAFERACKEMGINKSTAASIVGVNRSTLTRKHSSGLSPDSKAGELGLHLVRLYRSLFAISGGDQAFMQHWINTPNKALQGTPLELITSVEGLMRTNTYLDAMRGKI